MWAYRVVKVDLANGFTAPLAILFIANIVATAEMKSSVTLCLVNGNYFK